MKDGPTNTTGSSEISARLHRLRFIKTFYMRVGQTATRALVRTQSILTKEVTMPPKAAHFIKSLSTMGPQFRDMSVSKEDIAAVVQQSNEVLASATTVFPMTLFPDSIILDRTKLTVTRRSFFASDVMSIRIEDILNVSAAVGPLFGSLTIATRVMSSTDHFTMRHFTREDVIHLKHMIQGYVIARHNNIACDHLTHDELIDLLQELGQDTNKDRYFRRTAPGRLL